MTRQFSSRQMMTPEVVNQAPPYPWFAKRRNIIGLSLAFFLVALATSFFLCYRHYQEATRQALSEDQTSAGLYALILEEHLLRIVRTMESYANRPLLIRAVAEKNAEKAKIHLVHLIRNNPDIASLIITDRAGTLWISEPSRADVLGRNFAHRDWYQGVNKQGKAYVSDAVLRITAEKDTAIHVAVPILDDAGEIAGFLQNTQRAISINQVLRGTTAGEESISVSVIDRRGVIICSTRYPYEKELVPYPVSPTDFGKNADRNRSATASAVFPGGREGYISSATVTGIGWSVLVERDRDSILAQSSVYFLQTTAIFVLLFLTFVLLLVYFRKRVMAQTVLDSLHAEKELLASETRFSELFDHMSSGVAVYEAVRDGADFIILDLNASGRRITGVAGDVIGRSVREVFPGVEDFGIFRIFQQVWRTGVAVSHPNARYQDGRLAFWAENYVYKLPSGQVVAMFDDITERTRAEKALRESEQRYRLLFSEMISGYALHEIICDSAGKPVDYRFLSVNKAFETLTGLSAADIIGKTVLEILPAIEPFWIERYGKVALTGEPVQFENYFGQMNKYFEVRAFRPEAGKFAVIFNDVTERRNAEEKIKRLYAELEQRVIKRTAELSAKTDELERLNRVFVDRELRMRELKERIGKLESP
ncbi:MAG: PAS domain S-box protein [Deltaproteobacteria bacterium]|nr:PAS domain S-box protein [Deltaproteobacteria bacterium]